MKGRITCWLGMALALVLIVYVLIPPPVPSRHLAGRIICAHNLHTLGQSLFLYAQEHEQKYPEPDKWCDALIKHTKLEENYFICRGATRSDTNSTCHYSINPNCRPDSPNDVVLLFETKNGWNQHGGRELLTLENHQGKGCNVLFADGHVEWIEAKAVNTLRWEVNEVAIQLKTGDKAPGFELSDQDGKKIKLSDFAGKKVLLYFYPKADTPGCTTQACSVRDSAEPLKDLGVVALGISPDEPDVQKKFDEKYSLGFTLLSDADHKTAQAYGVWGEKSMYGKKYMGIIRSSFLIDEKGKIIQAWYKVSPADTVPNALAAIQND